MMRSLFSWYIFFVALLESVIKTQLTAYDNNHGFVSNNGKFLEDGFSSIHEDLATGLRSENAPDLFTNQIKFDPTTLDFMQRPLGVPHLKKVTLFNFDSNKTIDMTSISGSTVHFHSSFFEDKKIPPMGNTTFNVVFLGREEGFMESSLFIHTTEGHIKYDVKGVSVYSPYRLRPIVGVRLPLNATFSPLIYLHNPHSEAIQIVEVYTSGGDFHLELPSGEREGPKDMWEIQPLDTKAVIRVKFSAKVEQNHTSYVRIKLNNTEEVLVVPLEVEVSSSGGIYHPQGSVDFGVGGSLDLPKLAKLCLFNPFTKPMRIHSISTNSAALRIDYETVKLQPNLKAGKSQSKCTDVADLTLNWQTAFDHKEFSGKITVKYRNGKSQTDIPYYLTVLEGGISYDPQTTKYFINDKSKSLMSRNFKLKNDYRSPLRVISVELPDEAKTFFTIDNFEPQILQPHQEVDIFVLNLKPGIEPSDFKIKSNIFLHTNISDIEIPLLSYNGTLQVHLPFKSKDYMLDLGLLGQHSKREFYFLVYNQNPVGVEIKELKCSIPMTKADIVGCGSQDYSKALMQESFKDLQQCSMVNNGEYAVIKLTAEPASEHGPIWGEVHIQTQFEDLLLPVQFKVAHGKLEIGPDRLVFDQCFPGKICSHPLRIHSTFDEPMVIEDIVSYPPDPRLTTKYSSHISAHTAKVIGHLYLDPSIGCGSECYTGVQEEASVKWLQTLTLPKSVAEYDLNLVNIFYNRYLNLTSNGLRKWQNLTLRLDTSEVRGHIFKTRVKMSWPSLLMDRDIENNTIFTFPLTQIGNVTYEDISIKNPSSSNLIVQIVMDKHYPGVEALYEGLPPNLLQSVLQNLNRHSFIFHQDAKDQYDRFVEEVEVPADSSSIPVLLKPNESFTFKVGFKGESTERNGAVIFIRNNLTILEIIKLHGRSVYPQFKFGNRKPGASQPLIFELPEKSLKECEEKSTKLVNPNLTVRRMFSARNTGDITIYINEFYINDLPCEGYGFKVLNCAPFVLPPNGTKKIEIAFTPDLTLSKVVRTLILKTSLNCYVNYTLQSTIPAYYLYICSKLIPRPQFEWYISGAAIYSMIIILLFIIFLALVDADKIKQQVLAVAAAANASPVHPVLDLNMVGEQTISDMHSSVTEEELLVETQEERREEDKATSTDDIPIIAEPLKPPKIEIEKPHPALVPTVGKTKKKLGKRNSNEPDEFIEVPKKSDHPKHSKHHKPIPEAKEVKKLVAHTKEKKPVLHRKLSKSSSAIGEEETSSTTTESSTNVEDVPEQTKVIEVKHAKYCSKKFCKSDGHHNQFCNKDNIPSLSKAERKRSFSKSTQKQQYKDNVENKPDNVYVRNYDHKKGGKNLKERKEKQAFGKKLSAEKSPKVKDNYNVSPPQTSPQNATNMWAESRATFSDIVARTEQPNTKPADNRLTVISAIKPTMFIEPYKQKPIGLGPIGSKPTDYWQDEGARSSSVSVSPSTPTTITSNNSFFSNGTELGGERKTEFYDELLQQANWFPEFDSKNDDAESDVYLNGTSSPLTGPWNGDLLTSTSLWNNNTNASTSTTQNPSRYLDSHSNYLWGTNLVWQPLCAETSRPSTRTPPGFDPIIKKKPEEQILPPPQPRSDEYNPFTTNHIWTQQQKFWNTNPDP